MSSAETIKNVMNLPGHVVNGYLADLSDEDLMRRPHESANHIAWQLGHLITAEHNINNMLVADSAPALPEGFAEKHSKETAASNDQSAFLTKDEYLKEMQVQREGTMALIDQLDEEALMKPSPENLQMLGAAVGACLAAHASHWMMHAGQWVIVRRQLGRTPLF
ncbi:MAG: DinB family protein [bacterium]|nr:DinB family protein [bacterium]